MNEPVSDVKIKKSVTSVMEKYAGQWFAYQNQNPADASNGKMRYLRTGYSSSYHTPPAFLPLQGKETAHNYVLIGEVDIERGKIKCVKK